MEDPALTPSSDDADDPSPQIQQHLEGDEIQAIGEMKGSTAFGKIIGNVIIYNYYGREELQIATIDTAASAEADLLPCPYRDLYHFEPEDAEYFFGRKSFVDALVEATQTGTFIPLLGASGSGKSSVVWAGLVPKLIKAGHWQFTHFRPGTDPFYALAEALVPLYRSELDSTDVMTQAEKLAESLKGGRPLSRVFSLIQRKHPNDRVLLIADQFEELYTLCTDEITRRKFLDLLLAGIAAPADRIPCDPLLVATMRADFLGNALSYRSFADVLQNADLKLGPMNRAELTEAIEKPAQKLGVTFEAGLVERILGDVEAEPGILPLLEFALTELWQRRSGKQLTHAAYEAIGEVQGALGRHANQEYAKFKDEADRERVRRIFIQLVRPGEGAEDTRRIATKAELGEQNWSLVKQLADARLVVTSRNGADLETVEVVHEALIRNWGELRGWMEIDRVFRAWQERLRGSMRQWQETREDEGSLLRGAALAEAEEQIEERPQDLSAEQEFIEQSIKERDRQKQEQEDRRQRDLRISRRITVGSLMAVLITTGFGMMAWSQKQQTELKSADVLALSALSQIEQGKYLDAFVSAIKGGRILQSQNAPNLNETMALQELLNHKSEYNRLEGHDSDINRVSFNPDGKILATASRDKTIKLWNVETGKEIYTLSGHSDSISSLSFSTDGKTLATGSDDKTIKLWDVDTGKERRTLTCHSKSVDSVSFSPDGKTLATGSDDKTIKLWDVDTGTEIRSFLKNDKTSWRVRFNKDGVLFAIGFVEDSATIAIWNLRTGQEINIVHNINLLDVSLSPDCRFLAISRGDKKIELINLEAPKKSLALTGHSSAVGNVSFSPGGKVLITGGNDKTIKFWNVETGKEIRTLAGDSTIESINFNPDGKTLAISRRDKRIELWNIEASKEIRTLVGHDSDVLSVNFSPDGKTLASGGNDQSIKLWNIETEKKIHTLKVNDTSVLSVSFSPDGKTLATGSWRVSTKNIDWSITIWNVETGAKIRTLSGTTDLVYSVKFSPNGKILANGTYRKTIKLWNIDTGKEIRTLTGHGDGPVYSVSFSPDGKTLASGSDDKTIKLWNSETGKEIRTFTGHDSAVMSVSFSPDGKTLASGSTDKTIKLWNIDTGEEIRTLRGHDLSVSSVSFNRDGKTLASGSTDKTIKLWNIDTGKEIRTLTGHDGVIHSVSFSPDGKILATGSHDKTIKLWNRETGWDLDALMGRSCDWTRAYFQNNINVSESDRHLCDGIGTKKQ
jgi:WD40 repeat protein